MVITFKPVLELVETGDFGEDGSEEAVFFSCYNFDGCILYYGNLQKAIRFGWLERSIRDSGTIT